MNIDYIPRTNEQYQCHLFIYIDGNKDKANESKHVSSDKQNHMDNTEAEVDKIDGSTGDHCYAESRSEDDIDRKLKAAAEKMETMMAWLMSNFREDLKQHMLGPTS